MILKTRLYLLRTILSSIDLLVLLFCGVFTIYVSNFESLGMLIFGVCILVFGIVQFVNYLKVFYLYDDKIIIVFPFALNLKLNKEIKLEEIKEVKFKGGNGRLGPYIRISFKKSYDERSFRINFSESEIDNFITELNNLNIKTERENI